MRDVEQRGRDERPGLGQGEGRRSRPLRPDLQLPGQCAARTAVARPSHSRRTAVAPLGTEGFALKFAFKILLLNLLGFCSLLTLHLDFICHEDLRVLMYP